MDPFNRRLNIHLTQFAKSVTLIHRSPTNTIQKLVVYIGLNILKNRRFLDLVTMDLLRTQVLKFYLVFIAKNGIYWEKKKFLIWTISPVLSTIKDFIGNQNHAVRQDLLETRVP